MVGYLLNINGAINRLQQASNNSKIIEETKDLAEEIIKTNAILFYERYNYFLLKNGWKPNNHIEKTISNKFINPSFETWKKLSKSCLNVLSQSNDNLSIKLNSFFNSKLNEDEELIGIQIIQEINKLILYEESLDQIKNNLTYYSILDKIRQLRNCDDHDDSDEITYDLLIKSGIDKFLINLTKKYMESIGEIILIRPYSINENDTEIKAFSSTNGFYTYTTNENHLKNFLGKTILFFQGFDEAYLTPSNLLYLDNKTNQIYVYNKMLKREEGRYTCVPVSGNISSIALPLPELNHPFDPFYQQFTYSKDQWIERFGKVQTDVPGLIHNVPHYAPYYVERDKVEKEILDVLSAPREFKISLGGEGGVGKTETIKKITWDVIYQTDNIKKYDLKFDLIIWVSAKETIFEDGELKEFKPSFNNLGDFLNCILYVTNNIDKISEEIDLKKETVLKTLNTYSSILLILDNLETVSNKDELWDYLTFLTRKVDPQNIILKIITTSRIDKYAFSPNPYQIPKMDDNEARKLVEKQLKNSNIYEIYKSPNRIDEIIKIGNNTPLLIITIVFLLKKGTNIDELKIEGTYEEILKFSYEKQWSTLSANAKKILFAALIANGRIHFNNVRTLCRLKDDKIFIDAKRELNDTSFVDFPDLSNKIITITPTTMDFLKWRIKEFYDEIQIMEKRWENIQGNKVSDTSFDEKGKWGMEYLLQEAVKANNEGRYPAAEERFEETIETFRYYSEGWFEYGKYLISRENYYDAIIKINEAKKINQKNPEYYKELARCKRNIGNYENNESYLKQAIEDLNEAIKYTKDEYEIHSINNIIGGCYRDLSKMVYQKTYNKELDYNQKILYKDYSKKHLLEAIKIYENNLFHSPDNEEKKKINLDTYLNLSTSYYFMINKDRKNQKYYNIYSLYSLITALKTDPNPERNERRYSSLFRSLENILSNYGVYEGEYNDKSRRKLLSKSLNERVENDYDKVKFKD